MSAIDARPESVEGSRLAHWPRLDFICPVLLPAGHGSGPMGRTRLDHDRWRRLSRLAS